MSAKLSMSLDDIIQANRTAPTPKKEKVRARPRRRFPLPQKFGGLSYLAGGFLPPLSAPPRAHAV